MVRATRLGLGVLVCLAVACGGGSTPAPSEPLHAEHKVHAKTPVAKAKPGLDAGQVVLGLRGHEAELYTRAVDIVVSRLRKKLEPLDCIKTLRNAGYSLALRRAAAGGAAASPASDALAP